jgi:hypothetical protein
MSVAPFPDLDEASRIKENEAQMKGRKKREEKKTSWANKKGIMAGNELKEEKEKRNCQW